MRSTASNSGASSQGANSPHPDSHPEPWRQATFWAYLKPHRRALAISTLVGVTKYNLPILFPWLLKDSVDFLLTGKRGRSGLGLDGLMVIAAALFVLYALITHLRTYIAERLAQRMILDIRTDLFRHLQTLPMVYFQNHQTGAIATRLVTDVAMAQNYVALLGTNVFMDVTSLVAIGGVMLALDVKLALLAFSTLPLYAWLHRHFGKRMQVSAREQRRRMALLEGALHESIAGIGEIKSFTHEDDRAQSFAARCRHVAEVAFETTRIHAASLGTSTLLTRIPLVLVIWIGGHLVLQGEVSVGALMAFYAYLEMVYRPLDRLSELNLMLANSRAAIQRIGEFLALAPEEPIPHRQETLALRVSRGSIAFHAIHFGHRLGAPLFHGLELRIPGGQRVALVGPSGAGKSTLVKLLVRFIEPQRGWIEIDGQRTASVSLHSLRQQIAVVHQDLVLFSGSIEDNVRIGKATATHAMILAALERANARAFVEALPEGLQTEIGERGVRLSGGQKQRIAIARAFLKDAPILVFDESTSNLDSAAETEVYQALERLMAGRTTIIIAHRLSTVAHADRIVVLDRGRIVQDGTHALLLQDNDGLYNRLYRGDPNALSV